ncbi:rRNA maturation RNase YbeY [Methylophilus methylotrophus]|uniref:rRNA maturation RNase YbeY n=1 Tax=Methylophilus methylotrophus TaxID=17 RepID=UPI000F5916DA|nr:rRNA maturation RNase YbeY [Methylophilus methylotrophus]
MPQLDFSLQLASQAAGIPSASQFRHWVRAALRVETSLAIRIVDEEEGRQLNASYRGKDYATNVLTFPLTEQPLLMGDIVICAPVVAREAMEQGKPLVAHYAHMTVHGVLHLHGYDHEIDAQADLMEAMEVAALHKLGFANPYAE